MPSASWHTGALASQANQLAAMPSLHIAWAVWCTLALWQISARTWVRCLAVLYPCMTALAVLATGNHFVLDLAGGLAAIAAGGGDRGGCRRAGGSWPGDRCRSAARRCSQNRRPACPR